MKTIIALLVAASLYAVTGCHTGGKPGDVVKTVGAENLVMAAWRTHANFIKTHVDRTSDWVPQECWEKPLADLKPLRVYLHRVNVVVVLRETRTMEEGLYICIPISSYAPIEGEDGFLRTQLARDVMAFRRAKK